MMSEGRALTNCIGNARVATLVIAKWEGRARRGRLRAVLANPALADPELAATAGAARPAPARPLVDAPSAGTGEARRDPAPVMG